MIFYFWFFVYGSDFSRRRKPNLCTAHTQPYTEEYIVVFVVHITVYYLYKEKYEFIIIFFFFVVTVIMPIMATWVHLFYLFAFSLPLNCDYWTSIINERIFLLFYFHFFVYIKSILFLLIAVVVVVLCLLFSCFFFFFFFVCV